MNVAVAFAFVFLVLATLKIPEHPRVSFGWLGMAIWFAIEYIPKFVS